MPDLLDSISNPGDLKKLPLDSLPRLADEIRAIITEVTTRNGGHLASNLGVVELTIALHYVFDFLNDRLIWDVGHQCYAHKILTDRKDRIATLRQHQGLSGYQNKKESPYDLVTTGHAGAATSVALGMACAAALHGDAKKVVAVVGDAGIATGMAFEAMNHAGVLGKDLLVILNDNEMSISRSVGAMSSYLTRLRTAPLFTGAKESMMHLVNRIPVIGPKMEKTLDHMADTAKAALLPGWIFQELGFSYYGPIDGHDVAQLVRTLGDVRKLEGVRLLHVLTNKGQGHPSALQNPRKFHGVSPAVKSIEELEPEAMPLGSRTYTEVFAETAVALAEKDRRVVAITAAMPDGTGLHSFGEKFPDRFFDTGIAEPHAVGFASGLAAAGARPIAAIYSTFLHRAFDQIWHDVCLQNHPVIFAIDRAGVVGEDGESHSGFLDVAYMRLMPRMVVMAPKDATEFRAMLHLAVAHESSPISVRYPRGRIPEREVGDHAPFAIGEGEQLRDGSDGVVFAFGTMVYPALAAAEIARARGLSLAVVNARFAKPLPEELILDLAASRPLVVTVEEAGVVGGFGSAVHELLATRGVEGKRFVQLGLPDRFVEHGPREDLLRSLGLSPRGIARAIEGSFQRSLTT
jgi:1-deoxy-D-xylulose-5-phosphate synthase